MIDRRVTDGIRWLNGYNSYFATLPRDLEERTRNLVGENK